jgi:hypothetical protein
MYLVERPQGRRAETKQYASLSTTLIILVVVAVVVLGLVAS